MRFGGRLVIMVLAEAWSTIMTGQAGVPPVVLLINILGAGRGWGQKLLLIQLDGGGVLPKDVLVLLLGLLQHLLHNALVHLPGLDQHIILCQLAKGLHLHTMLSLWLSTHST